MESAPATLALIDPTYVDGGAEESTARISEELANKIHWSMNCSSVCHVFEKLKELHSKGKAVRNKREVQQALVFPPKLRAAIASGESLFPYLRLFLPQLDMMARPRYFMKEAAIADLYISVYNLAPDSDDARGLRNYKDPYRKRGRFPGQSNANVGDFALIARDVAETRMTSDQTELKNGKRVEKPSNWTLKDVNRWLDEVSATKNKTALFTTMIRSLPANEQMWLLRVILRDMKIGIKQDSILAWYHPDALEAYHSTLDLQKVCEDALLRDPTIRRRYSIKIMQAFQPMMAERLQMDEKKADFLQGWSDFYIERKLDGERMLVHKRGTNLSDSEVKIYSRNAVDNVTYSSVMRRYFIQAIPAREVILDGELLGYDDVTHEIVPFGNNTTVANEMAANLTPTRHLCYNAFDIVWISGWDAHPEISGDITQYPLEKRKALLTALLKPVDGFVIQLEAERVITATAAQRKEIVLRRFEEAIDRSDEGLMLKRVSSKYDFGNRSDEWLKLKPEYSDAHSKHLDVIVIGGYYGDGTRRARDVSHFLLGVIDEVDESSAPPPTGIAGSVPVSKPKIRTVKVLAKVGSGYKLSELEEVLNRLKPHFVTVRKGDKGERTLLPEYMGGWKPNKRDDIPDVVLDDPNNGLVLELKGAELTPTEAFNAGYTVRFPRVEKFRPDLTPPEAKTYKELMTDLRSNGGRLVSRGEGGGEEGERVGRAKSRAAVKRRRDDGGSKFMEGYEWRDLDDVEEEVGALEGAEVYVLPHPYEEDDTIPEVFRSRAGVGVLVKRLGGVPKPDRTPHTKYAIGLLDDVRTERLIRGFVEKGVNYPPVDVIKPMWLYECYQAQAVVELEPQHIVLATDAAKAALALVVDKYGDHHTRKSTMAEFKAILAAIPAASPSTTASWERMCAAMKGYEPEDLKALKTEYSVFRDFSPINKAPDARPCLAYFDMYSTVVAAPDKPVDADPFNALCIDVRKFQLYGGFSSPVLNPNVDVIIMSESDPSRVSEILQACWDAGLTIPMVRSEWIDACISAGEPVDFKTYKFA